MSAVRWVLVGALAIAVSACWTARREATTLNGVDYMITFQPERAIVAFPGRVPANEALNLGADIIAPHTDCVIDFDLHKAKGISVAFTKTFTQITFVLECGPDSHPEPATLVFG